MKERIGALNYDTKKARKIGEYSSDLPASAFGYYKEALYKKQNGEYFLVGEGGPRRSFAAITANGLADESNARIKPLTLDKAREWYKDFILDSNDYSLGDKASKERIARIYKQEFKSAKERDC